MKNLYINNTMLQNNIFIKTIFALFLMLGFAMQYAMAADVAATVFFKSGSVTANSSLHGLRHLEKNDSIYSKDSIDTADNGRVQLRFTDGGLVSLMPGSIFSVEEYLFDEADENSSAVFGLLKGGLRTVTGAIGKVKHEDYELKTPVATLGIRGTEFTVILQNANTLLVHVGRGKVVITNDSGSLEVLDGQNAIVTLGNAPELTDQEPMFLATAPTGDDLNPEEYSGQDPHTTDVLRDMPRSLALGNVLFHTEFEHRTIGAYAVSSASPIGLFHVDSSQFVPGADWDKSVHGSNDSIEWGTYRPLAGGSNFTGSIGGNNVDISLYIDSALPYVSGIAMINYTPAGRLTYSIDTNGSGLTAYNSAEEGWTVNTFNLGIDLANSSYDIDFGITGSMNGDTITANGNGSLTSSFSDDFSFNHGSLDYNGTGGCGVSSSCSLEVNGFLAGNQAQAAGINFKVDTADTGHGDIYGAVPLTNTGGNTGLGGSGPGGLVGG